MADILKLITAERYIDGEIKTIYYLATYQTDGWAYFNDDKFWRYHQTNNIVQMLYLSKEIWVNTNILEVKSVSNLDGTQVQNVANGSGAVAPNANVEKAVQWMIDKVSNNYITYSQTTRNLKNLSGSSYDCSSFVITGFFAGGYNANATYTGDMRAAFIALGFTWIPGTSFTSEQCIRGDILLNETLHTQVYIGGGQDVNCGSTPARVQTHSDNNYGNDWDGILRYIS